jgi:hypothetical protein
MANASVAAQGWAAGNVRHFRLLLYAITVVFLATEVTALTGLVPALRPVSLRNTILLKIPCFSGNSRVKCTK